MSNKNATIFQYIQNLINVNAHRHDAHLHTPHYEKMKSIWDANYLLIYREPTSASAATSSETDSQENNTINSNNNKQPSSNFVDVGFDQGIEHILKLLSILRRLMLSHNHQASTSTSSAAFSVSHLPSSAQTTNPLSNTSPSSSSSSSSVSALFASDKLNAKLIQQLQDPLCLASRSLPPWCPLLLTRYRFLFPFETRQLYFQTTAFGVSRSIVWLQQKRDQLLTSLRAGGVGVGVKGVTGAGNGASVRSTASAGDDLHEFRIGRLKHERVKIPREPQEELMRAAVNALRFHASRKAILEIEFADEEGTGLGPTLEFYSLIAAQLQMKKFVIFTDLS